MKERTLFSALLLMVSCCLFVWVSLFFFCLLVFVRIRVCLCVISCLIWLRFSVYSSRSRWVRFNWLSSFDSVWFSLCLCVSVCLLVCVWLFVCSFSVLMPLNALHLRLTQVGPRGSPRVQQFFATRADHQLAQACERSAIVHEGEERADRWIQKGCAYQSTSKIRQAREGRHYSECSSSSQACEKSVILHEVRRGNVKEKGSKPKKRGKVHRRATRRRRKQMMELDRAEEPSAHMPNLWRKSPSGLLWWAGFASYGWSSQAAGNSRVSSVSNIVLCVLGPSPASYADSSCSHASYQFGWSGSTAMCTLVLWQSVSLCWLSVKLFAEMEDCSLLNLLLCSLCIAEIDGHDFWVALSASLSDFFRSASSLSSMSVFCFQGECPDWRPWLFDRSFFASFMFSVRFLSFLHVCLCLVGRVLRLMGMVSPFAPRFVRSVGQEVLTPPRGRSITTSRSKTMKTPMLHCITSSVLSKRNSPASKSIMDHVTQESKRKWWDDFESKWGQKRISEQGNSLWIFFFCSPLRLFDSLIFFVSALPPSLDFQLVVCPLCSSSRLFSSFCWLEACFWLSV